MRIPLKDTKSKLAYHFTFYVVLLGGFITLLTTAGQMYGHYRQELFKIEEQLHEIKELLIPVLNQGEESIRTFLAGMVQVSGSVQYISINNGLQSVVSYGEVGDDRVMSQDFSLPTGHTLHIVVNLKNLDDHLLNMLWVNFITNAINLSVVAIFLFWFFSKKVSRPLKQLANEVASFKQEYWVDNTPNHFSTNEFTQIKAAVTQLRHSYQNLSDREQHLQQLFKLTPIGLSLWRLDGTFISTNPAFAQMVGRPLAEILTLNYWNDVIVELDLNSEKNYLQRLQAGERYGPVEKEFQHRDGYLVPVRMAAVIIETQGQLGVWCCVENIAAQKRALIDLHHAKHKAEEANRSKSQFLANMGHELRTPMTTIVGYSEMLEEEIKECSRPDLLRDIKNIRTSARNLLTLIDGILDISKIEAGKMDIYVESFDVKSMVDHVVQTIQPLIDNKANTLQVRLGENLGKMHTDLVKIRQILLNLLSNASKFSEQGTIQLEVNHLTSPEGEWVTFLVSDEGIGMTNEQQTTLFQLFTKTEEVAVSHKYGTMLGLALTKHFTEMLGGTITVASEFGRGSCFTVRLPAQLMVPKPSFNEDEKIRPPALPTESGVVLVIDDDEVVRNLLRAYLSKIGYQVVVADNGEEGLKLAKRLRPNAITLDVMMPGMDGWEVLSQLKAEPELAHIPVIVLTMLEEKDIGYSLGAAEYLTKPISRDQLTQVLRKYRSGKAAHVVMVVEDDDTTREMMVRMLHKVGWQVIEAANGEVALRLLDKHRPDLILLDLMMPEMDGFEFIIHLRQHKVCAATPVVVVTARDITVEDRLWLSHRVDSVFQKGIYSQNELLADLRALLVNTMSSKLAGMKEEA